MAKQILVVLVSLAALLATPLAQAQDQQESEEKVFNLIVGDEPAAAAEEEEVDEESAYEPHIEAGRWSVTLTLGYIGSAGTLLEKENLIYKVTDDAYFFGDVEIQSESAFNPIFRVGYNLTPWLALEGQGAVAFAEYTASISDPYFQDPNTTGELPTEVTELGDFDRENRSALSATFDLNALVYPFNLDGDARGRFHPYVTGGVGYATYNLDSDYTDTGASGLDFNLGVGVALIADDLISLRSELIYRVHSVEFEPASYYQQRQGGTVTVPVYEFSDFGTYSEVTSFDSHTLSSLTWQLGFQLGF